MLVLTHNTHYTMPIVPVRPISLCSIGVSPVEFANSWYFGLILSKKRVLLLLFFIPFAGK